MALFYLLFYSIAAVGRCANNKVELWLYLNSRATDQKRLYRG